MALPRVGACFAAWQGVDVPDAGASLSKFLLAPLGAEAHLALTHQAGDRCSTLSECQVATRLRALTPVASTQLSAALTTSQLVEMLESLSHWPSIMRAYNSGAVSCPRSTTGPHAGGPHAGGHSPYRCSGIAFGNSILAPVLGDPKLHVLQQLHGMHDCIELISKHEASRGAQYERIVYSRLEYAWLSPHPPLSLLEPAYMWVQAGQDYNGGLNDRHALLPRAAAEFYLRRWDFLLNGKILKIDRQLRFGRVRAGNMLSDENYVHDVVNFFGIEVRRFPVMQFLGCCNLGVPGAKCFHAICFKRKLPALDMFGTAPSGRDLARARPGDADRVRAERSAASTSFVNSVMHRSTNVSERRLHQGLRCERICKRGRHLGSVRLA